MTIVVGELQGIAHEAMSHLENIEILESITDKDLDLI